MGVGVWVIVGVSVGPGHIQVAAHGPDCAIITQRSSQLVRQNGSWLPTQSVHGWLSQFIPITNWQQGLIGVAVGSGVGVMVPVSVGVGLIVGVAVIVGVGVIVPVPLGVGVNVGGGRLLSRTAM